MFTYLKNTVGAIRQHAEQTRQRHKKIKRLFGTTGNRLVHTKTGWHVKVVDYLGYGALVRSESGRLKIIDWMTGAGTIRSEFVDDWEMADTAAKKPEMVEIVLSQVGDVTTVMRIESILKPENHKAMSIAVVYPDHERIQTRHVISDSVAAFLTKH